MHVCQVMYILFRQIVAAAGAMVAHFSDAFEFLNNQSQSQSKWEEKNSETQLKISAILIQPTLLKFGWWKLFGNWNTDYSMLLSCKNSQSNSYCVLFHSLKIYSVLFTRSFSISWKCCIQLFHLYTCAIIFIAVYRTIYYCCCGMLVMPREQLVSTIVKQWAPEKQCTRKCSWVSFFV